MRKAIHILILLGLAHVAVAQYPNGNSNSSYDDKKLSKDLPSASSTAWVDVIIQFKSISTKDGSKALTDLLKDLQVQRSQQGQQGQQQGQNTDKTFDSIKALRIKIPAS